MSSGQPPSDDDLTLDKVTQGEAAQRPNRAQRRRKAKNRLFTKKGFTRVIHVGPGGRATNIPTKKGSHIDNMAHRNAKKLRKKRKPDA